MSPLNPLDHLEIPLPEHSSRKIRKTDTPQWYQSFLKPAITLIALICFGYFTMWLSLNYVKNDTFVQYVEKQILNDKQQDNIARERFEVVQSKLEIIINQQVSYSEQLKAYNQVIIAIQKQVDSLDDRVKYIERTERSYKPNP